MSFKPECPKDAALVERAQRGDAKAFEALYDRYVSGVARALVSFAGPDRDLLDDLTQDVFFRVIEGLESYTPTHPFSHWLYTIALNVGRNHVRRRPSILAVNPEDLDELHRVEPNISSWSEDLMADTLTRIVAGLPAHMREVVSLRVGSDMSYGEIAEVLGIPEGTARSRMHNAVNAMRERARIAVGRRRKENER